MTGDKDRRWFFFGAVLIGLAAGEILYVVFAPLPPSGSPPMWARLAYAGLPAWIAIGIERDGLRRMGWAVLSIGALASWGLEGLVSPTPRAVAGDLLQALGGGLFVLAGAPVEAKVGAFAFFAGLAAACLRAGAIYWLSRTLEQYPRV